MTQATILSDFLSPDDCSHLLAIARAADYTNAASVGHGPGLRSASVCTSSPIFETFWSIASEPLVNAARRIIPSLEFPNNYPCEMQLTWSRDGDFFARHIDEAQPHIAKPRVTFVYYIGSRDSYTGGELILGDESIAPMDNQLIMYPSNIPHEVSVVHGENASRVTINGWSW